MQGSGMGTIASSPYALLHSKVHGSTQNIGKTPTSPLCRHLLESGVACTSLICREGLVQAFWNPFLDLSSINLGWEKGSMYKI